MAETASSVAKVGDILGGKYVLREHIADGGMGSVFVADQPDLARTVVIKILGRWVACRREPGDAHCDEAIAASRVHHPGSVVIFDCNHLGDGTPYIAMEHLRGRSLSRIIGEEVIPLPRAIDLVLQILSALAATHRSGVVHADVKSENFLVESIDGADHVTMIDFGLARIDGRATWFDHADGEVAVSGTPEYMAPEVARGELPTARADLYGVGVILYELLTRATPFGGGTAAEIMERHLEDVVLPPSSHAVGRDIPAALDEIVLRALEKRPEDRFEDAGAFAGALRELAHARRPPEPALARGLDATAVPVLDAATCGTPVPRRRLARGSAGCGLGHAGRAAGLRRAIGEALIRGDVPGVAHGYLDLASLLAHGDRFSEAACELEEGIDVLSAGRGPNAPDAPKLVDRLVVALAAIYEDGGQRQRARRIAATTDGHPTLIDEN